MFRTLRAHPVNSPTLDQRMKLYSLAAAAASVSALALAQPAEAEIVITNKTIPIHAFTPVMLDLNGDGIADVSFYYATNTLDNNQSKWLLVSPLAGGEVIGKEGKYRPYASALVRGAKIGPGGPFIDRPNGGLWGTIESSHLCTQGRCGTSNTHPPYTFDQHLYGKWGGGHPNRFLGVKFLINGGTHYGWVRLTVTVKQKGSGSGPKGSFSATITEYGYETIANKSLDAGLAGADSTDDQAQETGDRPDHPSLGMLALGTDGLALWRREEAMIH